MNTHTPSAKTMGLVQRLAAAWINEIGLHGYIGHPEELFEHPEVIKRINRLRPSTLGVIAWHGIAFGKQGEGETSLYEVHNGTYLGKYEGGKELLRTLARTAIAAEISDQLGRKYPDWRQQTAEPVPVWDKDSDGVRAHENMPTRFDHLDRFGR